MKGIYWRPRTVSRKALMLIAAMAVLGLAAVEFYPRTQQRPHHEEKVAAAQLAQKAIDTLREYRVSQLAAPVDSNTDPAGSGLIGLAMSPVTSKAGFLPAKQTSINPNFAAVAVEMLKDAGVVEGDIVGVAYSGSFPALNLAVSAAIETLGARPIIISSASASQWGANMPDFMWIDMERVLVENNVLSHRSVAASIGGHDDIGLGMSPEGLRMVRSAITERNQLPMIESANFAESIEKWMEIYRNEAKGMRMKAFVNVGGGTISTGARAGRALLHPGLNRPSFQNTGMADGVMLRFLKEGVPVIHMTQITALAERYGLMPDAAMPITAMPEVGEGQIYEGEEYNPWLVTGVLVLVLGAMYAFIRSDFGFRVLQASKRPKDVGHPEQMV